MLLLYFFLQGMRITMNEQLINHQTIVKRIVSLMKNNGPLAADYLGKCIYTVAIGNNDFLNNYFTNLYPTSRLYTPEQYADVLIQEYSQQLRVSLLNSNSRTIYVNTFTTSL